MFKPLQQIFLFQHLNQGNKINEKVGDVVKNGKILTKSHMEEAFLSINKSLKNPLKERVLEMVDTGQIKMVYAPTGTQMPTSLPFFLVKNGNSVVAFVTIDLYGNMNKEGDNVRIEYRKLFALLLGAYLAIKLEQNNKMITSRPAILSMGSNVYSQMMIKPLNKKYALNLDRDKQNKLIFLFSKFFMINILGNEDSEMITNYAKKNCKFPNPIMLDDLDAAFGISCYKDLSTFMQEIINNEHTRTVVPNLTMRAFLEQFILMYDASTVMCMESLPYFIHNIMAVTLGSYLNNQYILEDIVEGKGAKIFNDLSLL